MLVLGFDHDSQAYQALSVLKQVAAEGRLELHEGAVVERDGAGNLHVREQVSTSDGMPGAAAGGLLGAVVGLLGGPLGVLLGGTTGVLFGTAADQDRAEYAHSLLTQTAEMLPAGTTGLIALVGEYTEEVIDEVMLPFDAVILRTPVADVRAEIAAEDEARRAAEKEARKVLRAQHVEARREKFDAWRQTQRQRLSRLRDRISHALRGDAAPPT